MNVATLTAIGYGILVGVGGVLGYAKAKSQMSLVSGLLCSILLIVGGIAHAQTLRWGLPLSIVVTTLLIIVFVVRLTKTRKFMPSGLMVITGLLALLGLTA